MCTWVWHIGNKIEQVSTCWPVYSCSQSLVKVVQHKSIRMYVCGQFVVWIFVGMRLGERWFKCWTTFFVTILSLRIKHINQKCKSVWPLFCVPIIAISHFLGHSFVCVCAIDGHNENKDQNWRIKNEKSN